MKFKLTITAEKEHELKPYLNAIKNEILLEDLYNCVFRPIIKYGQDEDEIKAYELVWEKLKEYLEDEEWRR